ncbi:MAG TPA: helix-turn-helix domain-containing protein [Bryobacteraceae bacterium]
MPSSPVEFEVVRPSAALARYVQCFWTLRGSASMAPQTIFPDGRMDLVFQLGDPFEQVHENGIRVMQSRCLLAGQLSNPITIAPSGDVRTLGVRFRPHGAQAFLRFPLNEVAGRILPLEDIWGRFAREILNRMEDARDPILQIESLLLEMLRPVESDAVLNRALDAIVRSNGAAPVADLASHAGISRRQIERVFLRRVGIGPKLFSRIVRFQHLLRAPQRDWAVMAADSGYFDQAHLIHDFREFTGQTPMAWRQQQVAFLQDPEPAAALT